MLILWPSPDAENRKTLQISCCCWNLTHTEGYLHQITQKPLLSVANGALHDWGSPGAPRSCSPDLQSTCTQASRAAWLRLLPHLAWFMANELTKLSLKVSWITKLCDSLQDQEELCNCCRSQPDRTVEIDSSWEYQRIFLSSFNRKYLCISAG